MLERCGKVKSLLIGGSITGFPVVETMNSDITEYIATNVISITDGQFYLSRKLFLDSCRPAIDVMLSVTRIGSSAQCRLVRVVSSNIKYIHSMDYLYLFLQGHIKVSSIECTILLLFSL